MLNDKIAISRSMAQLVFCAQSPAPTDQEAPAYIQLSQRCDGNTSILDLCATGANPCSVLSQ